MNLRKLFIGLVHITFAIFVAAAMPGGAPAATCAPPAHNCTQQCAGLPSYPTYQYESCLTSCNENYNRLFAEYEQCREKPPYPSLTITPAPTSAPKPTKHPAPTPAQRTLVGTIFDIRGGAWRIDPASKEKIFFSEGDPVALDELIYTSEKGRAGILLPDRSAFYIGPNSEFMLDKFSIEPGQSPEMFAQMLKGIFRYVTEKAQKVPRGRVNIRLPVVTIGIRGTDVIAAHDQNSEISSVYLNEGEAEIMPNAGRKEIAALAAEHAMTIDKEGAVKTEKLTPGTWAELKNMIANAGEKQAPGDDDLVKIALISISGIMLNGAIIYLIVRWFRRRRKSQGSDQTQ